MSRVTTLICVFVLLSVPGALVGQDPETAPDSAESEAVAVNEKSPLAAGAIELFLPTGGYGYAGDWSRGIPPLLVRLAGGVLMLSGGLDFAEDESCEGACVAGLIVSAAGTVWGVVGAAATARRTNERLRAGGLAHLSISPVHGPDGTGMRIGMRLPVGR